MRTRLVPLLATALAVAAPLALTASPATAAVCGRPTVVLSEVDPDPVVIGTTREKPFDLYVQATATGCAVSTVRAVVTSPTGGTGTIDLDKMTFEGEVYWAGGLILPPAELVNGDAGTWTGTATARTAAGTGTTDVAFRVLRASRLSFNATPEPVTRGRTLTATGTLTRASWDSAKYIGYDKRDLKLQFRPDGGRYTTVKSLKTVKAGAFRTTVTATVDGCYRLVFGGTANTSKVTSTGDCIDVR